ncbi:MAG: HDOD domain-containing protein [Verrucomicrobia bacterium]|nr:HDOD domain-containing protein [Verrucomicrobiota bacterium]MBI3867044.1 HDOD domain-containing protein [Verrucomicrobiota bacterium]
MKRRLLLVGDGPRGLQTLKTLASGLGPTWEVVGAAGLVEAQCAMGQGTTDAVVTELRVGGASGLQFLNQITELHPKTQRFLLADLSDKQAVTKCVGTSHHYLATPCDPETLRAALDRAFSLDVWLMNDRVKKFTSQMQKLPSIPSLYFQVVKELQSPTASLETIGNLIAKDLVMTAKLLQLINSAVFGLRRQIASPTEAVLCLGAETTKSVLLLAHTFSYFDKIKSSSFSVERLWEHALSTGTMARQIAAQSGASLDTVEESFTAGLLHDIGKLVIACNLTTEYIKVIQSAHQEKKPLWVMEESAFSLTHAEVGACVLGIWGLPVTIVEGVALHHYPSRFLSKTFSPLTAVHIANAWDQEQKGKGKVEARMLPEVDMNYIRELELADRLTEFRAACKLPPIEEKPAPEPVPDAATATPDTSTLALHNPLPAAA